MQVIAATHVHCIKAALYYEWAASIIQWMKTVQVATMLKCERVLKLNAVVHWLYICLLSYKVRRVQVTASNQLYRFLLQFSEF